MSSNLLDVNPLSTNPTKCQTQSAFADELFECLWPFCEVVQENNTDRTCF